MSDHPIRCPKCYRQWVSPIVPTEDCPWCEIARLTAEVEQLTRLTKKEADVYRRGVEEIARLTAEVERLRLVHESELGVCQKYCNVVRTLQADHRRLVIEIRDWWLDGEKRQVWYGGPWLQKLLGLDENWKMDGEP